MEEFDHTMSHWREDLKGKEINGYVLMKKLGQGVSGSAYKALDLESDQEYVIKVISLKNRLYFERERKVLKYLSRNCEKYVVCYIDSFQDDQYGYIVMEYLKDYVSIYKVVEMDLDDFTKQKVITDLIKGMEYLHSRDVTHGDFNISNIMFDKDTLKVKYIDFGDGLIDNRKNFKGDYHNLSELIYAIIYGTTRSGLYWSNLGEDQEKVLQKADQKVEKFMNDFPDIQIGNTYLLPDLNMMRDEGLPGIYYSKR